ncbi:SHOCT domain-containing protein [Hymenobacter lucidus]|uniref:SHOCT domain-containing protein n=1 Tax=Hymenobacter lucidus TaxID=2880930 RepID=A0ABS8ALS4_9BACT|nr:SHOCT domain-containing protein [Hymenobacter lucidus]MCB2407155.1 hypothetical protein [Hymenobacter lucidus]
MEKDPSPLDTLRQLKEWLDAGTITPAEFETLKRKLLFNEQQAPSAAAPVTPPAAPIAPSVMPPPVPEARAVSAPIEDPLLPPIVTPKPAPTQYQPPVEQVTAPATPDQPFSHPRESGRPGTSPSATDGGAYDTYDATEPELAEEQEEAPYVAPTRSPLSTILIVGGILALLALTAYLTLGNRESEHLSSATRTEQDSLSATPEVGPQAEQIDLPPAAAPETVRVAPAIAPAAPAVDSASTAPAATPEPVPAPTPADDSAVRGRIESLLSAYYEDLKAAPFSAAQYFSPTVERFYTLQNTTPAAINEELVKSHFPEFLEASSEIEPGSLQISDVGEDGSRVVTFLEKSQAFRQSQQKHQQTRAQVRVRLDKNYKIKYLRQERLLENTFTD